MLMLKDSGRTLTVIESELTPQYFMQSADWARVKKGWIPEYVAVRDENGKINGCTLVSVAYKASRCIKHCRVENRYFLYKHECTAVDYYVL